QAAQFYDQGYYEGSSDVPGYCDYKADRALRLATARARLKRIMHDFLSTDRPRALDVGCGFGDFLEGAEAFSTRLGVETSFYAAQSAIRLSSIPVALASADALPVQGPFDLVTLWDVFEHLPCVT